MNAKPNDAQVCVGKSSYFKLACAVWAVVCKVCSIVLTRGCCTLVVDRFLKIVGRLPLKKEIQRSHHLCALFADVGVGLTTLST